MTKEVTNRLIFTVSTVIAEAHTDLTAGLDTDRALVIRERLGKASHALTFLRVAYSHALSHSELNTISELQGKARGIVDQLYYHF